METKKEIEMIAGKLSAEPKVCIMIHAKNRQERYWEGGINGHFYRIERGVPVEVPESLAKLIRQGAVVELLAKEGVRAYRGGGRKIG